ncbi:MAG: class I SAM-dependent methyltransferase [Candidatus Eisenbacteria bacterium]|nr:class I SAM-dependent methyltransferase [Candidatus Eisenbacteria bacterium]
MIHKDIADDFEKGFLSETLLKQIEDCDSYELAHLFLELFREHQPVLEAGCGSGRWNAWFRNHGIRSDGIDWSEALCSRARKEVPECRFFACDMRSIPLESKTYGGVIALGSIEHALEGPIQALREFNRVLRDDGVAVITVPYGGVLRRTMRFLQRSRYNNVIRRLFGKPYAGISVRDARKSAVKKWHPRLVYGPKGWFFYEYELTKVQMRVFLNDSGFEVQKEFIAFLDEGILGSFGRIAGTWDAKRGNMSLTFLGRLLTRLIPVSVTGHMLCYVVKKKGSMPLLGPRPCLQTRPLGA